MWPRVVRLQTHFLCERFRGVFSGMTEGCFIFLIRAVKNPERVSRLNFSFHEEIKVEYKWLCCNLKKKRKRWTNMRSDSDLPIKFVLSWH